MTGMTSLDQTIRQMTPVIDQPGPGQWRLKLPRLPGGSATGHATDAWFRVTATADACLSDGCLFDEWELLTFNARLPIIVRYARDARTRQLMLCADIRLHSEVPLAMRLREAFNGLMAVEDVSTGRDVASPNATQETLPTLTHMVEECGWPVSEREGQPDVPIGVSSTATVRSQADGGLSLACTLAAETESDPARAAITRCLLATTGVVRGVRASVRYASGKASVRLETGFVSAPCVAELHAGLSALSVASERCTREVHALQDPRVAEAYLDLFSPRCSKDDIVSAVRQTRISATHDSTDGTEGGMDDDFGHDDPLGDDAAGERCVGAETADGHRAPA